VRNIDLVLKLFRNIDYNNLDKLPPAILKIYDQEMRRRIWTKSLLELGPEKPPVGEITLFPHQQLGREIAQVNDRWCFFYDTRTGKTPMSLQIIQDDVDLYPGHRWLVLCPLILIKNAWLPDAASLFPRLKVINTHGKSRAARLDALSTTGHAYLCNIESFVDMREHLEKMNFHGVIMDESSAMKSYSSKYSVSVTEYAQLVRKWYLLSGTPAPNGEWEYYKQLQSVDYYGVHQSFNQFQAYFFDNISRNPQYKKLRVKPERQQELISVLQKYSHSVNKEDVLTTPGRKFSTVEFKLPDELKAQYDMLKQDLALSIGDSLTITSKSTAGNLNKLNQVTSGFIIDTEAAMHNKRVKIAKSQGVEVPPELDFERDEWYLLSDYRVNVLQRLIADRIKDRQAIIWCYYHKEFELIQKMLGDKACSVYGAVAYEEKNRNLADFKAGRKQFLLAHPASVGKGLTMTNAHVCVYFSMGYSLELWQQSIERIYGDISKQPNPCEYYILIAKGTVDKVIYDVVRYKGDMSAEVLSHLKGG
jgi:SNF2 family DNA or RNA helicase